jgi:hypothetical protein
MAGVRNVVPPLERTQCARESKNVPTVKPERAAIHVEPGQDLRRVLEQMKHDLDMRIYPALVGWSSIPDHVDDI